MWNQNENTENQNLGRRERGDFNEIVKTRPHDGERSVKGGERIKLQANYFRLLKTPKWNIYKYDVKFEPECMMGRLRNALVMQHKAKIGGFLFDGVQLFLTRELETDQGVLQLESKTRTDEIYTLTLKFTTVVAMDQPESLQILNLILRRATAGLRLELVGRNYYDAASKVFSSLEFVVLFPFFQLHSFIRLPFWADKIFNLLHKN